MLNKFITLVKKPIESQMKIFQAFDQYVEDNDNTHLMQEETKLQVLKQLLKNPKGISGSAVINDF